MRKLLSVVALLGLASGTAFATYPKEFTTEAPMPPAPVHRIRLDRSLFDQVGPRVNVDAVCGRAGARQVENKRSGGDVVLTFLSIGFYTPTHVEVTCNPPRR